MDLALRKDFLAHSGAKRMKVLGGVALLAVLAPHANAAGVCLSVGGPLYGGGVLASAAFIAGCNVGFSSNVGSFGGVVTTNPNPLPSPITQLTTATLNYSDPTGSVNTASASLDSGTLGAFDYGSVAGGNSGSVTALLDFVHFHITDGATSVPIVVNAHLSGTESGGGVYNNRFYFGFGGALDFQMSNLGGYPTNYNVNSLSGWVSSILTNESPGGLDFSGTINVTNGQSVELLMALQLTCLGGETCDFSHTAALSFTLPSDVTFTSDSGVLLTQTGGATAAPEPASFALMGAGLAALIVFGKKGIHRRGSDTPVA